MVLDYSGPSRVTEINTLAVIVVYENTCNAEFFQLRINRINSLFGS